VARAAARTVESPASSAVFGTGSIESEPTLNPLGVTVVPPRAAGVSVVLPGPSPPDEEDKNSNGSEATLADARRRAEDDPALARELFGLDRELIGHLKKQVRELERDLNDSQRSCAEYKARCSQYEHLHGIIADVQAQAQFAERQAAAKQLKLNSEAAFPAAG